MPPESCPNCGADIPSNATSCPECGSDESTGWSEEARSSGLGLPDDGFDYDEYVKEEFGTDRKPRGIGWFWWVAAVAVLLLFLLIIVR
jgi:uncharacterized membrane protein YvbJ